MVCNGVRVLAVGDVHSPDYLNLYVSSVRRIVEGIDAILWAGDMVRRGRVEALEPVLKVTREVFPKVPIIAVFGNEEYVGSEPIFRERFPEVVWIDDDYVVLEVGECRLGIVGTRGALERPTRWQRQHMPELWRVYRERPRKIEELIVKARRRSDIVVLLSHYTVGFETAKGEPGYALPEMGSRAMAEAVRRAKPDVVFHGHAHRATVLEAQIDGIRVYNVSLPARKNVYVGLVRRVRRGLEEFF